MSKTTFTVGDDKKTLVVEREFPAGKDRVWAAYSDPDLLRRWWSPAGWETTIKHMDFRNGGYWHYGMKCMDEAQTDWFGKVSWGKGTFSNIQPKDSLEYLDEFCDEDGKVNPDFPSSRTVVTLVEKNGRTTVTSTTRYATAEGLAQVLAMGMEQGLTQTWDKLEQLLAA